MGAFDNYECDGQITITDYLATKIKRKEVKDLTEWINGQGKAQYGQVKDLIRNAGILTDEEAIDRMTNKVSVYILEMSIGYMKYLREESQ